jgi:hypothetical protein
MNISEWKKNFYYEIQDDFVRKCHVRLQKKHIQKMLPAQFLDHFDTDKEFKAFQMSVVSIDFNLPVNNSERVLFIKGLLIEKINTYSTCLFQSFVANMLDCPVFNDLKKFEYLIKNDKVTSSYFDATEFDIFCSDIIQDLANYKALPQNIKKIGKQFVDGDKICLGSYLLNSKMIFTPIFFQQSYEKEFLNFKQTVILNLFLRFNEYDELNSGNEHSQ